MKTADLRFIAEDNGLEYIETTNQSNGYPTALRGAIIGFETYEQAQEVADEHGLSIESFKKKDGWQLWYRTGYDAYKAFENSADDFGDNYMGLAGGMDEADFFEGEVKPRLGDFDNFEDLEKFLTAQKEIYQEIETAEENETVIVSDGYYVETIKNTSMSFYHDTNHTAIGLIDNSTEEKRGSIVNPDW